MFYVQLNKIVGTVYAGQVLTNEKLNEIIEEVSQSHSLCKLSLSYITRKYWILNIILFLFQYEMMEKKRNEERKIREKEKENLKEKEELVRGRYRREVWIHPGGEKQVLTTASAGASDAATTFDGVDSEAEELSNMSYLSVSVHLAINVELVRENHFSCIKGL